MLKLMIETEYTMPDGVIICNPKTGHELINSVRITREQLREACRKATERHSINMLDLERLIFESK